MTEFKFCFIVGLVVCCVIFSEQCNVGLGNLGFGNVGVGNVGYGNKGVGNSGFRNIGVLNRRTFDTIGVANFMRNRRIGVGSVIAVPNPMPMG